MNYRVRVHPTVAEDLARIREHLLTHEASWAEERLLTVEDALVSLARNPFVGRPSGELRELIIGRDAWGYVALYAVGERRRVVQVLAIRHQREAGYTR